MAAGFPGNPSCPSGRPDHPPRGVRTAAHPLSSGTAHCFGTVQQQVRRSSTTQAQTRELHSHDLGSKQRGCIRGLPKPEVPDRTESVQGPSYSNYEGWKSHVECAHFSKVRQRSRRVILILKKYDTIPWRLLRS
eukprot:1192196-Prorocentrum_minimum.AAC.3